MWIRTVVRIHVEQYIKINSIIMVLFTSVSLLRGYAQQYISTRNTFSKTIFSHLKNHNKPNL